MDVSQIRVSSAVLNSIENIKETVMCNYRSQFLQCNIVYDTSIQAVCMASRCLQIDMLVSLNIDVSGSFWCVQCLATRPKCALPGSKLPSFVCVQGRCYL